MVICCYLMENEFVKWLSLEMKKRGISQAELARRSGVTQGTISRIMGGERNIGNDVATSISQALKLPLEEVMRAAGLLPQIPKATAKKDELLYLYDQLPEKEKDNLIKYIRVTITLLEQSGEINPKTK